MNKNFNFDNKNENFYDLLGCSINSSEEQILKEFKVKALKFHPDKNQDFKKDNLYNEKFQKLKEAKEILTDKKKRIIYDRWLLSGLKINFDAFLNLNMNNGHSFHWGSKKSEPMLIFGSNNQSNISNYDKKFEKRYEKNFKWSNETSDDILIKFRNYEI